MQDNFGVEIRFQSVWNKSMLVPVCYTMNAQWPLCKHERSLNKWRASFKVHVKCWGQVFVNCPSTLSNISPEMCWKLPRQHEVIQPWLCKNSAVCPLYKAPHKQGTKTDFQKNIKEENHSKINYTTQNPWRNVAQETNTVPAKLVTSAVQQLCLLRASWNRNRKVSKRSS